MKSPPLRVAYITAGAAGMFCGSCMHDNTLARALSRLGVDIQLVPTYTPIRTDEENVSLDRVFFGGINVYLQQRVPLFRWLPRPLDRLLDQPWLIRWATSRGIDVEAENLGALTVSMLRGEAGHQRKEVRRLCDWLRDSAKPQLVVFSNMLIAGCAPAIKKATGARTLVTLQGDDIFLNDLPDAHREQAIAEIQKLSPQVDGFVANSRYYAGYMGEMFGIDKSRIHLAPLGVEIDDFTFSKNGEAAPPRDESRPPTVGYLARLAREKGLHLLVDAFIRLRQLPGMQKARLRIAGWLGEHNREYAEEQFQKLRDEGLADAFEHVGEVDRAGKLEFLHSIDVLSVPTVYEEPKGLFVLEALAAGVPVVQPSHGAFPELLEATGGGRLFAPHDAAALAAALRELLADSSARLALARTGRTAVHERFHSAAMAGKMLEIYEAVIAGDG